MEAGMRTRTYITSVLASLAVMAAVGFPSAAQARLDLNPTPPTVAGSPAPSGAAIQLSAAGAQSGFRWGDAGIGAAGTVVLLGAGVAGVAVVRRRRTHRTIAG
jgi:hypothetical protein